jgi:hypothetical protein
VTIENSWAWRNGYVPRTTTPSGNGAGFKVGGFGAEYDAGAVKHTVRFSVAFLNKASVSRPPAMSPTAVPAPAAPGEDRQYPGAGGTVGDRGGDEGQRDRRRNGGPSILETRAATSSVPLVANPPIRDASVKSPCAGRRHGAG